MAAKLRVAVAVAAITASMGLVVLGATPAARGGMPEWLCRKLAFEASHETYAGAQETKCAHEVATLEKQRAEAEDAKGNAILPQVPTASPQTIAPTPIVGVFVDRAPVQLPSAAVENRLLMCSAFRARIAQTFCCVRRGP